MSANRITCAVCGAESLVGERACWQCNSPLGAQTQKLSPEMLGPVTSSSITQALSPDDETLRNFSEMLKPAEPPPAKTKKKRWTLTGDEVEVEEPIDLPVTANLPTVAGVIGEAEVVDTSTTATFRLTFCKQCGLENEEGAIECRRCKQGLEAVAAPPPPIQPLPRAWSFDVLGLLWIVLGVAAIFCGQFLVKADPDHPGITWADYFWTGFVVAAPGILIFMRHFFCKLLFYAMTFGSIMVWSVIGFIWIIGRLYVSDNMQVGLAWLAALSALSVFSWVVVRQNDTFDFGS